MNVVKAAYDTRSYCASYKAEQAQSGLGIYHAVWMLEQIIEEHKTGYKAQRWLGYAQGVLASKYVFTLDQLKDINRQGNLKCPDSPPDRVMKEHEHHPEND